MANEKADSKVLFRVANEDGSADVETLWAYALGDDTYRLANSPFYAYSVSCEDIVYAPYTEEEEMATFQSVVEKSGNSTVRIVFDSPVEDGNEPDRILKHLVAKGCSFEGAYGFYIAVNVPKYVDLDTVRSFLIETDATWEHADPTHAHLFPSSDED